MEETKQFNLQFLRAGVVSLMDNQGDVWIIAYSGEFPLQQCWELNTALMPTFWRDSFVMECVQRSENAPETDEELLKLQFTIEGDGVVFQKQPGGAIYFPGGRVAGSWQLPRAIISAVEISPK